LNREPPAPEAYALPIRPRGHLVACDNSII